MLRTLSWAGPTHTVHWRTSPSQIPFVRLVACSGLYTPVRRVTRDLPLFYNVTSARRLGDRRPTSTAFYPSGRIAKCGGREESPSTAR